MIQTHRSSDLNSEQRIAVMHTEGPLLVLAGAGSGKTRIVTSRIAHLIEQGISPGEILGVTFTNKAAEEMKKRVENIVRGPSPLISTFHALGARILRESIHHLGYTNNFIIYDEENSLTLLKRCLQTLNLKEEAADPKGMRLLISSAKNQCLNPKETEHFVDSSPLFSQIYSQYQERLKEANALDFDDLLFLTVKLFREKQEVLEAYQKRWQFLLIDEYQDTNQAQYLMAKLLVGSTRNLFVVGDPDQAIYSWRGANINNILNFEKDYPGAKIVRLEQNYRSIKPILDAANMLIAHNHSRYPKNLWSQRTSDEKINLFVGFSESDEAEFVTEEIDFLHRKKDVSFNEMAILYRTNFQSRSFEDYLLRRRLPYIIIGGLSFYQRKEIKDILAFLHLAQSENDFVALSRTLHLFKKGIGEATIERLRLGAKEQGRSLLGFIEQVIKGEASFKLTEKQKEGLKEYLNVLLSLREIAKLGSLQKLVMEAISRSGYLSILREEKETYEERKANLDELVGKAAEWEREDGENSLTSFLEELSLKSAVDEMTHDRDRIHLMTLHNGKGLEFNTVFLTGMEEDLFPHANARGDFSAIEEERRLCYVGMTRAKERLYLTAAEKRFLWGSFRTMRPSRFLHEIPKEKLQRIR